jgi:hypothetical protein
VATFEKTEKSYTPDGCAIWARNPPGAGVPPMVEAASHNRAVAHLKMEIIRLRKLLAPFAAFACSPPGECDCHNCRARDALAEAMGT